MASPPNRPPLTSSPSGPPSQPTRAPYPKSYGPSSSFRPSPHSPPMNAHEAFMRAGYGGGVGRAEEWVPYMQLGGPRSPNEDQGQLGVGSTFFVGGKTGTARLAQASKRPPLPIPPMTIPYSPPPPSSPSLSPTQSHPAFLPHTSYSPPTSPQQLPPGARPLPSPPTSHPPQLTPGAYSPPPPPMPIPVPTKVPLVNSSPIMVHSGFWQILQATGSRFLSSAAPTFGGGAGNGNNGGDIYDVDVDLGYLGVGLAGLESGMGGSASGAGVMMPGRMPVDSRQHQQQQQARTTAGLGVSMGQEGKHKPSLSVGGKKKRLSVDMIGRPAGFAHLAHASDFEQATDILHKWNSEGHGKLADPAWVQPIKEAARARARARGIAEVQANREDEPGSLKVINGLPASLLGSTTTGTAPAPTEVESNVAVEDEHLGPVSSPRFEAPEMIREGEEVLLPPTFLAMSRTNSADSIVARGGGNFEAGTTRVTNTPRPRLPLEEGQSPLSPPTPTFDPLDPSNSPSNPFQLPTNFLPSLNTIEKAVATKIYLEQHYHAILKKPRDREMRKRMLEKELQLLNISDVERRNVREAWKLSETEYLRDMRNKVNVGSFVKMKILGRGAFGVISLVKERGTGQLYAMKQLRKADMLRKGQEGHVRAERDLLAVASSATRWAVQLAYSFQDESHLYLVMTFMGGGDLLSMLIERDTFDERTAQFYCAEMVLAIEETHKVLGAIHRDIKPDNFLFSNSGHLLISDFGLATDFHWAHDGAYYESQRAELLQKYGLDLLDGMVAPATQRFDQDRVQVQGLEEVPGSILTWRDRNRRRLAYSVVGTNNYMSVEVLRGTGYDQSCDWWSLGIILYECLCGFPPFVSKSRQATRQKILNWQTSLKFPAKPRISREAIDLITRLICERENRLGSRATASTSRPNSLLVQNRSGFRDPSRDPMITGAEEIKAHPFFRGIDWETLHLQTPPFVPELRSPDDTRYFDADIEDEPLPAPDAIPGQPNATRDPMLRHPVEGEKLLETRKQLAFQGWTFKQKRQNPRSGVAGLKKPTKPLNGLDEFVRGRSLLRSEGGSGFRSLSI